ncbi:hypothetical protein [Streptomyces fradiae]|uniref:hypothetical protein n=1 Tax=Streptomyces fradiae TaxID=1906 RepID=UPI003985EEB1
MSDAELCTVVAEGRLALERIAPPPTCIASKRKRNWRRRGARDVSSSGLILAKATEKMRRRPRGAAFASARVAVVRPAPSGWQRFADVFMVGGAAEKGMIAERLLVGKQFHHADGGQQAGFAEDYLRLGRLSRSCLPPRMSTAFVGWIPGRKGDAGLPGIDAAVALRHFWHASGQLAAGADAAGRCWTAYRHFTRFAAMSSRCWSCTPPHPPHRARMGRHNGLSIDWSAGCATLGTPLLPDWRSRTRR